MTEQSTNNTTNTDVDTTAEPEVVVVTPKAEEAKPEENSGEVEKWKAMSKKNERDFLALKEEMKAKAAELERLTKIETSYSELQEKNLELLKTSIAKDLKVSDDKIPVLINRATGSTREEIEADMRELLSLQAETVDVKSDKPKPLSTQGVNHIDLSTVGIKAKSKEDFVNLSNQN